MEKPPGAGPKTFQLPKVEVETVGYDGSAIRATGFMIEFDGGSFMLRVFENREDPSPRPGPVTTKRQNVEIARFTVHPVALRALDGSVQLAKRSFTAATGQELPDGAKYLQAMTEMANEARAKLSDEQVRALYHAGAVTQLPPATPTGKRGKSRVTKQKPQA